MSMTSDETRSAEVRKEHPYRAYKREQELISRRKIYRTTAFYTTYSVIILGWAIWSGNFVRTLLFIPPGIILWMCIEYFSHIYILHGHFYVSKRRFKRPFSIFANKFLDPLHFGHHEKPFDGNHMSGRVRDMLPLFLFSAPVSIFLFPPFTASVIIAAAFQSYIAEEWIHHATHYYNFRDPYFRYMKKHHMYHHTSQGMKAGFGTSSGVLDYVFGTRYPPSVRQRLYGKKVSPAALRDNQPEQV